MKRIPSLLFVMLLSSLFFACGHSNNRAKENFTGTITEIYGESAIVHVNEGEAIRKSGSEVSVNLSVNEDASFEVGDLVEVGYDGEVREIFPLSINTEYVKLLKSN